MVYGAIKSLGKKSGRSPEEVRKTRVRVYKLFNTHADSVVFTLPNVCILQKPQYLGGIHAKSVFVVPRGSRYDIFPDQL